MIIYDRWTAGRMDRPSHGRNQTTDHGYLVDKGGPFILWTDSDDGVLKILKYGRSPSVEACHYGTWMCMSPVHIFFQDTCT